MNNEMTPTNLTMEPEAGESYGSRPRKKPEVTLTGRLEGWPDEGVYQFTPRVARPDLKREVLMDSKNLKVARTAGEKESSIILTAKVDSSCADPYGALLNECFRQLKDKAKKMPARPQGVVLYDNEGSLKIWQNMTQRKLICLVALDASKDKELVYREFSDLQTQIFKTISATKF